MSLLFERRPVDPGPPPFKKLAPAPLDGRDDMIGVMIILGGECKVRERPLKSTVM